MSEARLDRIENSLSALNSYMRDLAAAQRDISHMLAAQQTYARELDKVQEISALQTTDIHLLKSRVDLQSHWLKRIGSSLLAALLAGVTYIIHAIWTKLYP